MHVVIVDDEPDFTFMLALQLTADGFPAEAYDGADAFFATYTPRPGCVVLDIMMPDMSGFNVLRGMRERGWTVPVITMSAGTDAEPDPEQYPHWVGHLMKPFDPQVLEEKIRVVLGQPSAT